jgi:antitoxin VapB
MHAQRHVRLFRNGKNQAVRIPREFEFDAREVIMRREDDRLVIEPVRKIGLLATLALLQPLEEEFPDIDAGLLAPDDVDL